MRLKRIKMVAAATVGAVALSATGLAGTAQADTADDVQIMITNLPDAAQVFVTGTQAALDTLAANQSLDEFSFNLALLAGQTAGALAMGTEQFGSLGLGAALLVGGPISILQPYLRAFDEDPASVADQLDPNDLSTLLANLPAAVDAAQPGAVDAVTELLRGNLSEGSGLFGGTGTPAVVGSGLQSTGAFVNTVTAGTTFESTVPLGVGVPLFVIAAATASYVQDAEASLAPVFDGAAPVTEPIIAALEGI